MFISKSVHQSMEENCQDISTSERIGCIIDRVQEKLKSEENICLPFQYNQFFPELLSSIPQCTQDMASAYNITFVNKAIMSRFVKIRLSPFLEFKEILEFKENFTKLALDS